MSDQEATAVVIYRKLAAALMASGLHSSEQVFSAEMERVPETIKDRSFCITLKGLNPLAASSMVLDVEVQFSVSVSYFFRPEFDEQSFLEKILPDIDRILSAACAVEEFVSFAEVIVGLAGDRYLIATYPINFRYCMDRKI